MISYVKGELVAASFEDSAVVLEAGGIGYNIMISGIDYSILPVIGSEMKIYTYFSVREDAMQLYGFLDQDSLKMFKLLISVNGIGPKNAMAVLSVLSCDDLRFAILSGDDKAISKAPGVGGKTAQRVILELKDKISLEDAFESKLGKEQGAAMSAPKIESDAKNDAIMALCALGYSSTESLKAVSKVELNADMSVEEILQQALKHLL